MVKSHSHGTFGSIPLDFLYKKKKICGGSITVRHIFFASFFRFILLFVNAKKFPICKAKFDELLRFPISQKKNTYFYTHKK